MAAATSLQIPGRLVPPRATASAHPALRSWTLAVAVHGGIAVLLLAGTLSTPKPQPDQLPVFEIVLPAAQPVAEPVVKPRPRTAQPAVSPRSETPRADTTPAAAEMPQPPVATPALPQPAVATPEAMPPYAPILLDWLGRHRDYPRAARLRRQEGTPRIALTLDRSGRLLGLELSQASGHELLDLAALNMARRAAPFPPPQLPPGIEKATFIIPVQFHLERR